MAAWSPPILMASDSPQMSVHVPHPQTQHPLTHMLTPTHNPPTPFMGPYIWVTDSWLPLSSGSHSCSERGQSIDMEPLNTNRNPNRHRKALKTYFEPHNVGVSQSHNYRLLLVCFQVPLPQCCLAEYLCMSTATDKAQQEWEKFPLETSFPSPTSTLPLLHEKAHPSEPRCLSSQPFWLPQQGDETPAFGFSQFGGRTKVFQRCFIVWSVPSCEQL